MINKLHESTIAIDAMGGDVGLEVTVPAAIELFKQYPHLRIKLVGDEPAIEEQLQTCSPTTRKQISIHPVFHRQVTYHLFACGLQ